MLRTKPVVLALALGCAIVLPAAATQYFDVGLHGRVEASGTIVLARVVDPTRALLRVERILKGVPPKQIGLVSYVSAFAAPAISIVS